MHSVTETDSIMMPIAYNTAFSIYDWLKFLYKSLFGRRYITVTLVDLLAGITSLLTRYVAVISHLSTHVYITSRSS